MKALITGAGGFVGRWLGEHLESAGDEVWRATSRPGGRARERSVDMKDQESIAAMLAWARPDAVYHLAAVSFGPDASQDVGHAVDVTVRGTGFLLEAAAALATPPVVLIPSSSEVYGHVGDDRAIDESRPLSPVSVYGATKVAQESIALAFHRTGRVRVVVARAFNHIGPGQREAFVVASFAAQLAAVAAGRAAPMLRVGNLDARRDFADARDVVRAYRLLVTGAHTGTPFNVASGEAVSIQTVLDRLIAASGIAVEVSVEPSRLRRLDPPVVVGDASLLREATGWHPEIPLDRSLQEIWEDALRRRA